MLGTVLQPIVRAIAAFTRLNNQQFFYHYARAEVIVAIGHAAFAQAKVNPV